METVTQKQQSLIGLLPALELLFASANCQEEQKCEPSSLPTKTEPSSNPSSGSGNNTDIEHVGDNFCENSNILSVLLSLVTHF